MSTTTLRAYLDDVGGLLEQQALEEVIGHCRHILQHFPKNLETYRILGQALLEKNRHQEASDVFQRVLGALPDDFKAHIGMSACWEELQQLPRSIWHMERAFEVDPNNRALQDELKRLMEHNRQTPPARFTLSRAALARIYFNGKLYEQAISELQGAIPLFPDRYDLQVLYAQTLWNAEHVTQASEQALLVLETLPDSLHANRIMAALWLRENRPSDAKPYFIKVEQLDPFVAWDMLHDGGEAMPMDALKVPRLQWDVRAAAALATGTPDWMASIGEVFVDPEAVDLSIPSEKRKRVWLDDFGAPAAGQSAPLTGKPRTGGLIDKYTGTGTLDTPPAPVEQDDIPSWFKEFEKEGKTKKRTTNLSTAIPVWGDEAPDKGNTPALSVNAQDKGSSASTADADWLFDDGEMPPLPPEQPGGSAEVQAADALAWLQPDAAEGAAGATTADADWLFGDEDETPPAAVNADMPDTLDWLADEAEPAPKLSNLPMGDAPAVENPEDALAWLETGPLSPEAMISDELPAADSGVINNAKEALSWLQTGNLAPDAVPTELNSTPDLDWLLDENSAPPIEQQVSELDEASDMFSDEAAIVDSAPTTSKAPMPAQPEAEPVTPTPPVSWSRSDSGENASDDFAAWLDANPEPAPIVKPSDDEQGWISELQISDAIEAAALTDKPVETQPPMAAAVPELAASAPENEVDEFALMFDNIDVDAALGDLSNMPPPSNLGIEDQEQADPMAWAMDLGLDLPADANPNADLMDDFSPMEQADYDPLAWMREAGLEPPPELALDALDAGVDEGTAPGDDDAFLSSSSDHASQSIETGLDIQSTMFTPEQNTQNTTTLPVRPPEAEVPKEPEAAPAPLLDLSDPDWLNDFQPIEVPEDLALPTTGTLTPSTPTDGGLDWLAAFGTAEPLASAPSEETVEQESVDIGWLNQSTADQVTAMGADAFAVPESKPDLAMPTDVPAASAETPKIEAAAEDWLASFGVIADEAPLSTTAPLETTPDSLDAFSLDALLGDLPPIPSDTTAGSVEAVPATEETTSNWLASLGLDLDAGGEDSLSVEPADALDAQASVSVDETPDWLSGVAPLDLPASIDVASGAEDFSSFLDAFTDETPAAPPAEVSASTEALTGDNVDWLSAVGASDTPAAEVEAAPQVDGGASMDALLDENADWLSVLGSADAPAAEIPAAPSALPVAEDDLDSLLDSFIGEPTSAAAPAPSVDNLDWLGTLAPADDSLAEPPAATISTPAAEETDFGGFLNDLADIGDVPSVSAAEPAAVSDDFSEWLTDTGTAAPAKAGLEALDFSTLPSAEPDESAPDLSALLADLGVQAEYVPPPSMQNEADDLGLAPAALPDWLGSIAPPSEATEQSAPPSDTDLKRSTTPMDAFNLPSIEPPSEGPSSTGFTDLLRELKAGARPILPPTGMLPPEESSPAAEAQPMEESDWLAAFAEPQSGVGTDAPSYESIGTTSDDDFKLELDAALAPDELTDESEESVVTSTASFDIDSVTDLDLGVGATEQPAAEASNEDWLSSLGFTDEAGEAEEAPTSDVSAMAAEMFAAPDAGVEPVEAQDEQDDWLGAVLTPRDDAQTGDPQLTFGDTPIDADAPDWLRGIDDSGSSALESDQGYNAKSVAPAPDSGNTSSREEKPSSGFALPKRAPRWSRSGKAGDPDSDSSNQPRASQSMPVVPADETPEVPPEKKSANAPDEDFSNLLNSLLDDSDSDLSDLLK